MRGIVKPNKPYVQHFHAGIHITAAGREFIVDPKATEIVDKPDQPLVLPQAIYDSMREKFGSVLTCEPVGGFTGEDAAKRIAELEAEVADLKAQLAAAKSKPGK